MSKPKRNQVETFVSECERALNDKQKHLQPREQSQPVWFWPITKNRFRLVMDCELIIDKNVKTNQFYLRDTEDIEQSKHKWSQGPSLEDLLSACEYKFVPRPVRTRPGTKED